MNQANTYDIKILLPTQTGSQKLTKPNIPDEIYKDIAKCLHTIIIEHELLPKNLIYIVTNLMSVIGKYKTLSGLEKKELVIFIITDEINETIKDMQIKATLKLMVETVIPGTIDTLVSAANGKYKFKYIPNIIKLFKACKCCSTRN
jgi:hypothetical protein